MAVLACCHWYRWQDEIQTRRHQTSKHINNHSIFCLDNSEVNNRIIKIMSQSILCLHMSVWPTHYIVRCRCIQAAVEQGWTILSDKPTLFGWSLLPSFGLNTALVQVCRCISIPLQFPLPHRRPHGNIKSKKSINAMPNPRFASY